MCVISALATLTEHLVFTTGIYIAPLRDLMTVAKTTATAAVLSDDRLRLGVGVGWSKEEFDQTGQDFDTRGKRLDEMIAALRALWRPGYVEFHGDYYDVPECQMEPSPSAAVPIIGGGHSPVALRRTAALCDGWIAAGRVQRRGGLGAPRRSPGGTREGRAEDRRGLRHLPLPQRTPERRPLPALRRCGGDRLRLRPWMGVPRDSGHAAGPVARPPGSTPCAGSPTKSSRSSEQREQRESVDEGDEGRTAARLLGLGSAAPRRRVRRGSRPPRLRLRLDGGVLWFRCPDPVGLVGLAHREGPARHVALPALGAHADRHGHGRADDGPPLERSLRARPGCVRASGGRGLVRPTVPGPAGPHPRVRRHCAPGARGARRR